MENENMGEVMTEETPVIEEKPDIEIEPYAEKYVEFDTFAESESLRQNDKKIELIRKSVRKSVEDYLEYAKREHFSGLFYFENSDTVKVFDLVSGDENEVAIASLK